MISASTNTPAETVAEAIARLTADRDHAAELGMPVLAAKIDRDLRDLAIRAFGGSQ